MRAMPQFLREKRYKQTPLSMQKANYAVNMYRKAAGGKEVAWQKREQAAVVARERLVRSMEKGGNLHVD